MIRADEDDDGDDIDHIGGDYEDDVDKHDDDDDGDEEDENRDENENEDEHGD